jgi:hypothetical protein
MLAAKKATGSYGVPDSEGFMKTPFSFDDPRREKNEYQSYRSNRKYTQGFGYHERVTIAQYKIR